MITPAPKKRPVLNLLNKLFGNAAVRGTIKAFPVGNWIYEVVAMVKHWRNPQAGDQLPHSPVSLLFQAVVLFVILYAFFTHQLTIDQVLDRLDFSIDDFKSFFSAPSDPVK